MGPFSVFTVFVGVISCFWCGRQNYSSSFSGHGKIGNFIIIISKKDRHVSLERRVCSAVLGAVLATVSADLWLGSSAAEIPYRTLRSGLEWGWQCLEHRSTAAICRSQYPTRHAVRTYAGVVRLEPTVQPYTCMLLQSYPYRICHCYVYSRFVVVWHTLVYGRWGLQGANENQPQILSNDFVDYSRGFSIRFFECCCLCARLVQETGKRTGYFTSWIPSLIPTSSIRALYTVVKQLMNRFMLSCLLQPLLLLALFYSKWPHPQQLLSRWMYACVCPQNPLPCRFWWNLKGGVIRGSSSMLGKIDPRPLRCPATGEKLQSR